MEHGQVCREAGAERRPDARERERDIAHGGAADRDAGVAPWREPPRRIAEPAGADAEPGDEAHLCVDDDDLPMVARQPGQGTREARWIEGADLAARSAQQIPEAVVRLTQAPEPVADHAHASPGARALHERIAHRARDVVVAGNVVFE